MKFDVNKFRSWAIFLVLALTLAGCNRVESGCKRVVKGVIYTVADALFHVDVLEPIGVYEGRYDMNVIDTLWICSDSTYIQKIYDLDGNLFYQHKDMWNRQIQSKNDTVNIIYLHELNLYGREGEKRRHGKSLPFCGKDGTIAFFEAEDLDCPSTYKYLYYKIDMEDSISVSP